MPRAKRYTRVDDEQVSRLYRLWRWTDDNRYRDELYECFREVVEVNANVLARKYTQLEREELDSEVWMCLGDAIRTFDSSKGTLGAAFFQQVRFRLPERLQRHTGAQRGISLQPRDLRAYYRLVKAAYGCPDYAETMLATGALSGGRFSLEVFRKFRTAVEQQSPRSFDAVLHESAPSVFGITPVDGEIESAAARIIAPLLATLTADELTVIRHTYGLGGAPIAHSESSLAELTGLTRGTCRKLSETALEKLTKAALGGGSSALLERIGILKGSRAFG